MEFVAWRKIARLHRDWELTEKVDGTNGILFWTKFHDGRFDGSKALAKEVVEGEPLYLFAGSRNRWLTPSDDNFGFARWAQDNAQTLIVLGEGRHFGEWFGAGIQRRYGLASKRFALFDQRWAELDPDLPGDLDVVPVLTTADGSQLNIAVQCALEELRTNGSLMVPGFMQPEGIVVRHKQEGSRFKVLLEGDDKPKGMRDEPVS